MSEPPVSRASQLRTRHDAAHLAVGGVHQPGRLLSGPSGSVEPAIEVSVQLWAEQESCEMAVFFTAAPRRRRFRGQGGNKSGNTAAASTRCGRSSRSRAGPAELDGAS
jgi:hypothetical protein